MLILVYEDCLVRFDEPSRISAHRRSCGRIVAVDHLTPKMPCHLAEQRALAHRAGPVKDNDWLLMEPRTHDFGQAPLRKASKDFTHR